MALKKPSDFFGIKKVSSLNEEIDKVSSEPQENLVEDRISTSFSNIDSIFKDIQNQLQESSQSKINDVREEVVTLYNNVSITNGTISAGNIDLSVDITVTRPGWLTGRRPSQGQLFPRGVYNK